MQDDGGFLVPTEVTRGLEGAAIVLQAETRQKAMAADLVREVRDIVHVPGIGWANVGTDCLREEIWKRSTTRPILAAVVALVRGGCPWEIALLQAVLALDDECKTAVDVAVQAALGSK